MLPGVRVRDINKLVDERGFFAEIMREDWKTLVGSDKIVQVNISSSFPGTVRAWHRHERGQVDYIVVLKGIMKICAYDDEAGSSTKGELSEIVVSDHKSQIVRVPGHYWHGTKTLGEESSMTLYLVTCLYDELKPDELRRPWNDPNIVDPRTSKPYEWNKSSNK
jgi:dTDP-4-dehydrorhamnose 3,5-epimerase